MILPWQSLEAERVRVFAPNTPMLQVGTLSLHLTSSPLDRVRYLLPKLKHASHPHPYPHTHHTHTHITPYSQAWNGCVSKKPLPNLHEQSNETKDTHPDGGGREGRAMVHSQWVSKVENLEKSMEALGAERWGVVQAMDKVTTRTHVRTQ